MAFWGGALSDLNADVDEAAHSGDSFAESLYTGARSAVDITYAIGQVGEAYGEVEAMFTGTNLDGSTLFDTVAAQAFNEEMITADTRIGGIRESLLAIDAEGVSGAGRTFQELADDIENVNMNSFIYAIDGGVEGIAALEEKMISMGTAPEDVEEAMSKLTLAVGQSKQAIDEWNAETFLETTSAMVDGIIEIEEAAGEIRLDAFSQVLADDVAGGLLASKVEAIEFNEEVGNLGEALLAAGLGAEGFVFSLDETTEAGQNTIQALASMQGTINDGLNQALIDSGGEWDAVSEKAATYIDDLVAMIPELEGRPGS